ncbi:AMP-binding protein [Pseudonocardia sp. RS11V-5]|uniref:AMP-binding protein n=1 Tax=Pseudonocardia terrae TaxID=2905831 RepID=UPI001E36F624|nr:AMP-binding protein [Pseudonocardia terrae]MCE3555682.1 AMP-binding protein [Pseudonocardia terrae]
MPVGARVLLDIDDPLTFAVTHLAVIAAGRSSAPVNPSGPPAETARARAALDPALVLTDRERRPGIRNRVDSLGDRLYTIDALLDGLLDGAPATSRPAPIAEPGSAVLLTSGSTGTPKTVELSEQQLLHVASCIAAHHRLTGADRGYCPLPLFHVNAQVVGLLATLVAGGELVLDRRFRRTGLWQLVAERDVTWVNAVPAILAILARDPDPPHVPSSLRFVRSASAPLPAPIRALFRACTGLPVVESYGMTEAASQITATPVDENGPDGSAGRPVGVQVRITDEAGRPLPPGTVGRVRIRGAGVITSYGGGAAADRFDAGGWLDTGDLGRLDADGFLHLAGRADDVVNRGGELVHPQEVEAVLLGEPDVAEAVVVGRPHDVLGAVPVAYVRPGADAAAGLVERLAARCADELAPFKRPTEIRLVDAFPKGPTGKVRRVEVRRLLDEQPVG